MLKRLAAYQRQNQLDLALQKLRRVEHTLFMLDWLESPSLRQRCQADPHSMHRIPVCPARKGRGYSQTNPTRPGRLAQVLA